MPKRRLPPPASPLDPAIAQEMTIPLLEVPDEFLANFTDEELVKMREMDVRDVSTLTRFSKVTQWSDWSIGIAILQNQQLRQLEAEQIKRRKEKWGIFKWITTTIISGLILTLLKLAFKI